MPLLQTACVLELLPSAVGVSAAPVQGGGVSCDLILVFPGGLKAVFAHRGSGVLQCDRKQGSSSGVLSPF